MNKEKEAVVVGTAGSEREEDDFYGGHPSRLVDGKGLDGIWVYQPPHGAGPTVCAADPLWLSMELEVPYVVTKVQLARRINSGDQGKCIRISVGFSKEYDPNDALCRPEIDELQHTTGLVDYVCTTNHETGNFVKISKNVNGCNGDMVICEAKVFGYPAGKLIQSLRMVMNAYMIDVGLACNI